MQKILHIAYDTINSNETCDKSTLQSCLHNVLEENSHGYKEILSRMTNKQKSILIAIAIEGKAIKVTSGGFSKETSFRICQYGSNGFALFVGSRVGDYP